MGWILLNVFEYEYEYEYSALCIRIHEYEYFCFQKYSNNNRIHFESIRIIIEYFINVFEYIFDYSFNDFCKMSVFLYRDMITGFGL